MSDYLVDDFVTVRAGEPFRLFPFGKIVKGGKVREITRELAAKFKIPHYRPAIKLGSHKDETPAGGHIISLEVREDGLYAIPEWNDNGQDALVSGAYRYHSPEVMWEGELEDSTSGEMISGPLIVGDALLHNPALGEAAALYSVEPIEERHMTAETVNVPVSLLDRLFNRKPDEQPAPKPDKDDFEARMTQYVAEIEQYKATITTLEAQVATMEAEKAAEARVAQFAADLSGTAVQDNSELIVLLASLPDEAAKKLVTQLKALSAQVDPTLTRDAGAAGDGGAVNPVEAFSAAVNAVMVEKGLSYEAAVSHVRAAQPDLFAAYGGKTK